MPGLQPSSWAVVCWGCWEGWECPGWHAECQASVVSVECPFPVVVWMPRLLVAAGTLWGKRRGWGARDHDNSGGECSVALIFFLIFLEVFTWSSFSCLFLVSKMKIIVLVFVSKDEMSSLCLQQCPG